MNEHAFDALDARELAHRIEARELRSGPRIGDYVFRCGAMSPERITVIYNTEDVQAHNTSGSFYLGVEGSVSYSGICGEIVKGKLRQLPQYRANGTFWFFHHGAPGARRAVPCYATCRVYEEVMSC